MAMQYIQTGGDSDGYWIDVPDGQGTTVDPDTGLAPTGAMPAVKQPTPWEYAKEQNTGFQYTPQQLGWADSEAKRFADAGITKLPGWFNKELITSEAFHLGSRDPIANFIDLYNTPYDQATEQWDASKKAYGRLADGSEVDVNSDEFKEAYTRDAFGYLNNAKDSWWDRNKGMVMGLGSVASVAAGGYLSGAMEGLSGVGAGLGTGFEAVGYPGATAAVPATGATATTGSLAGIEGLGEYGFSNASPVVAEGSVSSIADAIAAGSSAGADVGMGAGTNALTAAGLPASYSVQDIMGLIGGTGAVGGGGASSWDSVMSWLNGGSTAAGSGSKAAVGGSNLGTLLGLGTSVGGALLGYNAQQNSIDAAKDTSKDSIAFQKYMYDQAVQNYAPFRQLGLDNLSALNNASATGDSGKYIGELESLGKNFTFDATDPAYTQKMKLATEANDKALASRGMYNSRAGLNLQDETTRNIQASEYDKQFNRKYGTISDLFNMTNKNAATDYSKLLDMVKIGSGAASSAGSAATNLGSSVASTYGQMANQELASGQSTASLFSGLGAQPLNYLLLQSLLNKN